MKHFLVFFAARIPISIVYLRFFFLWYLGISSKIIVIAIDHFYENKIVEVLYFIYSEKFINMFKM